MLKKIAAATTLPVTVDRAKQRLQIDSIDFDADLRALIQAAAAALEDQAGIILQTSSWEYRLSGWPCWGGAREGFDGALLRPWPALQIPAAPVRDVTDLIYLNEAGTEITIDPALYSWERTAAGADLMLSRDLTLPLLASQPYPVRVAFDAGYDTPESSGSGDDPELFMPPQAEMAILFLVGHWFRSRESVGTDQPYTVPQTFEYLAQQLRIYR